MVLPQPCATVSLNLGHDTLHVHAIRRSCAGLVLADDASCVPGVVIGMLQGSCPETFQSMSRRSPSSEPLKIGLLGISTVPPFHSSITVLQP